MGTRTFIVAALLALAVGATGRITYEQTTEPVYAQNSQRLQPTEQGNGRYVFTGSGANEQTTEPFQIDTQDWTITSESSTREPDTAPVVLVFTEDGNSIDTTDDFRNSIFTVNADPGRFYLQIVPLVDNVDYTVTVQEGSGTVASSDPSDDGGSASPDPKDGGSASPEPSDDGGDSDKMLNSGASGPGPVLTLPDGSCIPDYPNKRNGLCYR